MFATKVQYSVQTQFHEISTIDNSLPEELAPGNIVVEVRCTSFRVPKESASALAIQPTILNHLQQQYVSIEIRDRGTDDTMLFIPKAMLVDRTGVVEARRLANEIWTLRGIGYWDERPPEGAVEGADDFVNGISNLSKKIRNPVG